MGKIDLFKNTDKESIVNFLKCEIRVVDENWMRISMLINLIALIISVWFAKDKLIFSVICIVLCGIIGLSYLFFERKMIRNKKNLYSFHGMYTGMWSVSLGTLAYSLLEYGHKNNSLWIFMFLIIGSILSVFITTLSYVKKIKIIYYKNYVAEKSVITIPAMCVFL